jgi:hypothetical protein
MAHTLTSFAFSEVWICFCLSTRTREVSNPETPRYGTHSTFSPFRRFVHVDVWTSKLAKFQTPKILMYWSYLLPLFTFSKVMVCCWMVFETPTPRVPKSRMGSHFSSFSLFTISEVLVCKGLALKSQDFESQNLEWGPTFPLFHFSRFQEFWGVEVRFGLHETPNPETPKCGSHSSLFAFRKLLVS